MEIVGTIIFLGIVVMAGLLIDSVLKEWNIAHLDQEVGESEDNATKDHEAEGDVDFWQEKAEKEKARANRAEQGLQREKQRSLRFEEELRRERERARKAEERAEQFFNADTNTGTGSKDIAYYAKILGLSGKFTFSQVKDQQRILISQYHPDKVTNLGPRIKQTADEEMKKINEAYAFFKNLQDSRNR